MQIMRYSILYMGTFLLSDEVLLARESGGLTTFNDQIQAWSWVVTAGLLLLGFYKLFDSWDAIWSGQNTIKSIAQIAGAFALAMFWKDIFMAVASDSITVK